MNPFVSVIVPNYCHAKYLDERIQSVLNQTYQNFELILMDDCSPDGGASKAIIEKYRTNPHVSKIIYNDTNSGSPFKQWRKGIEHAHGEYVWIAESDDSCEPVFLDVLIKACIENDAVLGFCNSYCVDETSDKGFSNLNSYHKIFNSDFVLKGVDFIHLYLIRRNNIKNASSAVFKRDIALSLDRLYENYMAAGDWLFWIEMAEEGNVCYINKQLNIFRRHNSCVTKISRKRYESYGETIDVYNYLYKKSHINMMRWVKYRLSFFKEIEQNTKLEKTMKRNMIQKYDQYYYLRFLYPLYLFCYNLKHRLIC